MWLYVFHGLPVPNILWRDAFKQNFDVKTMMIRGSSVKCTKYFSMYQPKVKRFRKHLDSVKSQLDVFFIGLNSQSNIGVTNWWNSNPWNISISMIHDFQCYESGASKRLHTYASMPQTHIFIVWNWKYIFRLRRGK